MKETEKRKEGEGQESGRDEIKGRRGKERNSKVEENK